ncbi:MAG: hypothetical protein JJT85_02790 [Chromatiales bacterium]|nr:hypothetical protein [Chromatiales bacterium]
MTRTLAVLLLALFALPAVAQLSEEARRDLLLIEMAEAAMAFEHAQFLELLRRYEATGGVVEPEMRFYEAAALADGGELLAAFNLVTDFINQVGSAHPLYRQALELYGRLEPEAMAILEAQRREQQQREEEARRNQLRREVLLDAPLYAHLAEGEKLLSVERFSTPSPWRDGSSPQEIVTGIVGGVHRVEVHQGLLPRPDGGWIAFGQRPREGDAPEPERPRSLAAIRDGSHEPQSTRFPQAALLRYSADGQLQSSHTIDWRQVYLFMAELTLNPRVNRMGLLTVRHAQGLEVVGISPLRAGLETPIEVGDVITHVNRNAVQPSDAPERHVEDYRRRRPPPVRVLRNGQSLEFPFPLLPGSHFIKIRPGVATSWPAVVAGYVMDTAGMRGGHPDDPADFSDWSSEVIALVPGPGDRVTLCANLEASHRFSDHEGILQTGVVLRGRFDDSAPGGIRLDDLARTAHDHPQVSGRQMWWYDSGLVDCAGLPDGGLLTVSRAVRNVFSDGVSRPQQQDFAGRIVRTYSDAGYYNGRRHFTEAMSLRPPAGRQRLTVYALQPQQRLQPAATGSGWHWHWRDFRIEARGIPPTVSFADRVSVSSHSGTPLLAVAAPQASQPDQDYELVLNGQQRQSLLPRHAADHVQLKRVARRADGSHVVLLGVQQNEIGIGQAVPGGALGDVNGRAVRDYFAGATEDVRQGWLEPIQSLAGQEDYLLGLDTEGRLQWSLRLVPEQPVEPGFSPSGSIDEQMQEVGRLLMQEWTNLAVLADDSILVTMKNGHGLRVRR